MSWLKFLSALVELVLLVSKTLQDQRLLSEGEVRGATRAMELARARLQKAQLARAPRADDGVVRDDPYLRD